MSVRVIVAPAGRGAPRHAPFCYDSVVGCRPACWTPHRPQGCDFVEEWPDGRRTSPQASPTEWRGRWPEGAPGHCRAHAADSASRCRAPACSVVRWRSRQSLRCHPGGRGWRPPSPAWLNDGYVSRGRCSPAEHRVPDQVVAAAHTQEEHTMPHHAVGHQMGADMQQCIQECLNCHTICLRAVQVLPATGRPARRGRSYWAPARLRRALPDQRQSHAARFFPAYAGVWRLCRGVRAVRAVVRADGR